MATQEEFNNMSDSEKKKEDWMNSKWRPMMGWMYMVTCMCDFVIFPILWSGLQAAMKMPQMTQWMPLTLQGAGLFHIAMGAVLGIAAYGRTQEKLNGANNGGLSLPTSMPSTPSASPTGFGAPAGGFGAPAATGFGSPAPAAGGFSGGGFGSTPSPAPTPSFGSGFGTSQTVTTSQTITTTASGKKIVPTDPDPIL